MTHAHRAPAALALGLALALASACGDSEPTPAPQAPAAVPPPPAPADDDGAVEELEAGDAGTLPDGFPRDLLPPTAESTTWRAWGQMGQFVMFTSDLEPQALFDHFANDLGSSGWEVTEAEEIEPGAWQVAAKKGKTLARISITQGETGSEFAIAINEQP